MCHDGFQPWASPAALMPSSGLDGLVPASGGASLRSSAGRYNPAMRRRQFLAAAAGALTVSRIPAQQTGTC